MNFLDSEQDGDGSDFQSAGIPNSQILAQTGFTQTHVNGNWLTFDWQISYELGKPEIVTPETPKPGYNKEGKKVIGEKAVAPAPEMANGGIRTWLAGTKLTFGINNIFDTRPPFSDTVTPGFGYDSSVTSPRSNVTSTSRSRRSSKSLIQCELKNAGLLPGVFVMVPVNCLMRLDLIFLERYTLTKRSKFRHIF